MSKLILRNMACLLAGVTIGIATAGVFLSSFPLWLAVSVGIAVTVAALMSDQ